MRITLLDESIPFDGATPAERPLGGAERAFAALAAALVRRGHEVTAVSLCETVAHVAGVVWMPRSLPPPPVSDVAIAFRRPSLLDLVPDAGRKILWLATPAGFLDRPKVRAGLDRHKPHLVFLGPAHRSTLAGDTDLPVTVIPPGVASPFLERDGSGTAGPTAVTTTHPDRDLDRLVEIWTERIFVQRPDARLTIHSAGMFRAIRDGGDERPGSVWNRVRNAFGRGVHVVAPGTEAVMARTYREARVHLYPGGDEEIYPWTLAESQSCGCPAVSFSGPSIAERVRNGETGYIVPDDAAFANLTLQMLSGGSAYDSLHGQALDLQGRRSWDDAAADFEALWS